MDIKSGRSLHEEIMRRAAEDGKFQRKMIRYRMRNSYKEALIGWLLVFVWGIGVLAGAGGTALLGLGAAILIGGGVAVLAFICRLYLLGKIKGLADEDEA